MTGVGQRVEAEVEDRASQHARARVIAVGDAAGGAFRVAVQQLVAEDPSPLIEDGLTSDVERACRVVRGRIHRELHDP